MPQLLDQISSPKDLRNLKPDDLKILAKEIRSLIVSQVSKTGGHLAPNLGTVELTLALHYVYDTPVDKIIWDVGHQAYPHKIITGRYKQFSTIKQYGGISGFLRRSESEYDTFGAGHASTSLAAAMGFAKARRLKNQNHHVAAVIGDGSLTGGMAFEALNNSGVSEENVTFILNDNKMSIAPNVGAISKYLNRVISNPTYNKLKEDIWDFTGKLPNVGESLQKLVHKIDESVKHLILPGGLFEDLGLRYFGPIDGHNLDNLIEILKGVKKINAPCLIHILTEKGHGWDKSEKDSQKWHSATPFDIESGQKKSNTSPPSYAKVFGNALLELAREDTRITAITAAMADGVGVDIMQKEFPKRVFDVGIAEQYAVTFAAGMACEGIIPVCAIYSTFLQRAIDQIIHDVALQDLHVVFVLSHSGLVGADGPTHHGTFDLTYLRMIPGMVILAPSNDIELCEMLKTAIHTLKGPVAIRYPKGNAKIQQISQKPVTLAVGVPHIMVQGQDLLILAVGHMVGFAQQAVKLLEESGIKPTLVNARYVKPLCEVAYSDLISKHKYIITVEDNVISGGYGSAISELASKLKINTSSIRHLGLPDQFVPHGNLARLYSDLKLNGEGIYNEALELVNFNK